MSAPLVNTTTKSVPFHAADGSVCTSAAADTVMTEPVRVPACDTSWALMSLLALPSVHATR
jgi:hypothetical protein